MLSNISTETNIKEKSEKIFDRIKWTRINDNSSLSNEDEVTSHALHLVKLGH